MNPVLHTYLFIFLFTNKREMAARWIDRYICTYVLIYFPTCVLICLAAYLRIYLRIYCSISPAIYLFARLFIIQGKGREMYRQMLIYILTSLLIYLALTTTEWWTEKYISACFPTYLSTCVLMCLYTYFLYLSTQVLFCLSSRWA